MKSVARHWYRAPNRPAGCRAVRTSRWRYTKADDAWLLLPMIRRIGSGRASFGYRRVTVMPNRALWSGRNAPINHKRVYRLMSENGLHDGPDAKTVLAQLHELFQDYNEVHPHKGLKMLPKGIRRRSATASCSFTRDSANVLQPPRMGQIVSCQPSILTRQAKQTIA